MDEKQFAHLLDRVAARAIAPDADVLPRLHAHLQPTSRPRLRRPVRLVASFLLGLLIVVTTVYAAQLLIRDPGLTETMVTPLSLSQTIDDVTVTVDWVYADANRVQIGYTMTSPTEEISREEAENVSLNDQNGQNLRAGYEGRDRGLVTLEELTDGWAGEAFFEVRTLREHTGPLNLRFRIDGGFRFDITTLFNEGHWIEQQPDVTVNGVTISLQWAHLTPSMMRASVCYGMPYRGLWFPEMTLAYDGQRVADEPYTEYLRPHTSSRPFLSQWVERRCQTVNFMASYDERPDEVTVTIPSLQKVTEYSEENMQQAAAVYAAYGIETKVTREPDDSAKGGYSLWILDSEDVTSGRYDFVAIWDEALAAMTDPPSVEHMEGPWVITVRLP